VGFGIWDLRLGIWNRRGRGERDFGLRISDFEFVKPRRTQRETQMDTEILGAVVDAGRIACATLVSPWEKN